LPWRTSLRGNKRQAADALLNDVSDRRDMIQYPKFLEKRWQIGRSPTESTCKTLTDHLKWSGRCNNDNTARLSRSYQLSAISYQPNQGAPGWLGWSSRLAHPTPALPATGEGTQPRLVLSPPACGGIKGGSWLAHPTPPTLPKICADCEEIRGLLCRLGPNRGRPSLTSSDARRKHSGLGGNTSPISPACA